MRTNLPHPSRNEKRTSLINWYKDNWDIISTILGNIPFNDNDNENFNENDND